MNDAPRDVVGVLRFDGSLGRWVIEVRTGTMAAPDLRGQFEFTRLFPTFCPLVLCEPAQVGAGGRGDEHAFRYNQVIIRVGNPV